MSNIRVAPVVFVRVSCVKSRVALLGLPGVLVVAAVSVLFHRPTAPENDSNDPLRGAVHPAPQAPPLSQETGTPPVTSVNVILRVVAPAG